MYVLLLFCFHNTTIKPVKENTLFFVTILQSSHRPGVIQMDFYVENSLCATTGNKAPPSINSVVPVIYEAFSDTRNLTASL